MNKLKILIGVLFLALLVGCTAESTDVAVPELQVQALNVYSQPEETQVYFVTWYMDDSDANTGFQTFPETWQDELSPAAVAAALTLTEDDWVLTNYVGSWGRQVGFVDQGKAIDWSNYLLDTAGIGSKFEFVACVWCRRW